MSTELLTALLKCPKCEHPVYMGPITDRYSEVQNIITAPCDNCHEITGTRSIAWVPKNYLPVSEGKDT